MQSAHNTQAYARRGLRLLGAALAPLLFVSGCATNTQTGALVGAGTGGVIGGLLGSMAHVPVAGAVVGAAAGTMVGAAAGADADARQHKQAVAADVAARGGPLSLEQIRDMAQRNVSDTVIIDQIHVTRTVYQLTPEQINWLKESGVSDPVIHEMLMTAYQERRVIYAEPPPPVVGVGIGVRGRW
jgi:hypothetical protein